MGKNLTKQKPWTEADLIFLKENYGKIRVAEIAKALQRSESAVYSYIHTNKIVKQERTEQPKSIDPEALQAVYEESKEPEAPEAPKAPIVENNTLAYSILNLENDYKEKCEENKQLKEFIKTLQNAFKKFDPLIK